MDDNSENKKNAAALRRRAEDKVASQSAYTSEIDAKRLLHELQVHQVELVMQNEELQLANQKLKEHELHLQNVIKMTPAGYFRLDADDRFVEVNDAWLRMHFYDSREEIIGKHFSFLQVDSASDSALKHLAELHRGMPIPLGEFSSCRKDGSVGHHIFSAHPVMRSGTIVGFEWFIIDISARVLSDALLQTRIRMREFALQHTMNEVLTNSLDEAVALTGSTIGFFTLLAADEKQIELQVWSSNTLATLGQVQDSHDPVDVAAVWADCGRPAKPLIHNDYRALPLRKELPERHAAVVRELVVPIFRGDLIVAIFGIGNKATDYTAQDLSIISQLADQVWDIVLSKKTEEENLVLQRQFQQAQKFESLGVLAGGIAHNFNNNLSIILGNIELTRMKQAADSEALPFLQDARTAVHRSRDLVQKIITYSRKGIPQKKSIPLTTIIDETLALLRATMPTTITVQKSYQPEWETKRVNADASQIQEVLINLCNNAVHAMKEKGELTINLEPVELTQQNIPAQYACLPGCYAKLSIQDSGGGMSPEILDKIFDPFFSTKEAHEGAGMGLATVQGIVSQHGGLIKVNSILNQGTTFNLYFPIIVNPQTTAEPTAENKPLPKGTEQILFVDDDEMLAILGERLLSEMGYKVTTMTDSREALKMFTANPDRFDLIITDQTMPQLSGKDLIHELRKVRPDIPTILCSGYSSQINEEAAKELGISAFMMKPMDLPELQKTVRRVLDGNKAVSPR